MTQRLSNSKETSSKPAALHSHEDLAKKLQVKLCSLPLFAYTSEFGQDSGISRFRMDSIIPPEVNLTYDYCKQNDVCINRGVSDTCLGRELTHLFLFLDRRRWRRTARKLQVIFFSCED